MAYEKMEQSFPCRCGQGRMIAEWQEHDTWVSPNRSITWSFNCHNCSTEYEFYRKFASPCYVIRKVDGEKLRSMEDNRAAADALWESIDKAQVPLR